MERRQRIFLAMVAMGGAATAMIGASTAVFITALSVQACTASAKPEAHREKAPAETAVGDKTSKTRTAAPVSPSSSTPGRGVQLPSFDPKNPVALLPPDTTGGLPLMSALAKRSSSRSFSSSPLDLRILSDLFWAATGVNRPNTGQRTAPTARDRRDLEVYASFATGLYRYDIENHALVPILAEDIRKATGMQAFAATAPLNLIFVSDFSKIAGENREENFLLAGSHAGFVSQNVYLYCASAGLSTVVRGAVDKPKLAEAMHLRPDQTIVLTQTIGFPESKNSGE